MSSIYPVNKFKSSIYPNLSTNASSPTEVYSDAEVVGEGYSLITSMIASNKTNTPRTINLIIEKGGSSTAFILYDVIIPANTAFEVIEGNKVILKSTDRLLCYTDAPGGSAVGAVDMTVSYVVHITPS
jgi:hypothetical protein